MYVYVALDCSDQVKCPAVFMVFFFFLGVGGGGGGGVLSACGIP